MSRDGTTPRWFLVAEREVRTQARQKSFVLGFLAMLVLAVGGVVAMNLLQDRDTTYDVGVTSQQGTEVARAVDTRLGDGAGVDARTYDDTRAARDGVTADEVDAALVTDDEGWTLLGNEQIDSELRTAISATVSSRVVADNAAEQGVDLEALNQGAEVPVQLLDPEADDMAQRRLVGFGMGLVFYAIAVVFGMQIAQSVVQEKESRVVEILAAAIPTRSLLWGKVIGNTVLALGQVVVIVGASLAAFALLGNDTLLGSVGPAMGWFVAFFAIGFVALSALWSAAGALASRVQDVGATTTPLQMLLLAGYLLAVIGTGTVLTVGSQVPIISTMVMPVRIAAGEVALWEILLALGLNVLGAVLLVRLGALIYDRNLMQTQRKVKFSEALRGG